MAGTQANPAGPGRPLRADARRNREELLRAASEVFASAGVADASLEEIARRAGVGIGTLYRHFPSRDSLIEAVYRHEMEQLCDAAPELLATLPPDQALAAWMQRLAKYVATKRGMAEALRSIVGKDSELFAQAHDRIRASADGLLGAAIAVGSIRSDVTTQDLLRAVSGLCLVADPRSGDEQAGRLVGLVMDGLRYGAPGAPTDGRA